MGFDAIGRFLNALLWLCIVFVPLGIWQALQIVWWLASHISISFG